LRAGRAGILVATLVVLALAVATLVAGCGDDGSSTGEATPSDGASEKAVFTYAASGTYPPFSFTENGEVTGFDVQLGELLAEKMGMTPEFMTNPFETIIQGLNSNKYDAVIGSLTVTDERKQQVDFTIPYYTTGAQIYVQADNTDIAGPDDLRGKTIGVVKASTYLDMAQEMTDKDKAIGFDSDVIALQDLVAGRVDAVITDQIVGGLAIKKGLAIKAVGEPFAVADQAIAVRKDEPELLAKLNAALEEAKVDGSYKALSEKWLGQVLLSGVQ
jgi:polar amino acid transport system substrate-binding protein